MVFASMIKKDLDIGRLSWITQVGCKSNQKQLYKREAEGVGYIQKRRGKVKMEAEMGVMWLQAEEPLEAGRGRESLFP